MTPFLANDRVEAFYLDINSDEFKVTVQYHQDFCWMIWVWRKLSGMSWGKSSTSSHFLKIKLASCCQNSPKPKKTIKMIDSLWFLLTYNLSPHHTSKNSTSPIGSDSEIRQYPGTLVGWLVALVAESRIYLGVPRGHCCGPKSWCFFLPKTSMIRWKKWAFLGGICFFFFKKGHEKYMVQYRMLL